MNAATSNLRHPFEVERTELDIYGMIDRGLKQKWGTANLIAFKPYMEHADGVGFTILYVIPKGDTLEYVTHRAFIAKDQETEFPFVLESGHYFPATSLASSNAFYQAMRDFEGR